MSNQPKSMQEIIRELAGKNPDIINELGGQEAFNTTIDKIGTMDRKFDERGGVYFKLGSDPLETAASFTKVHIEEFRETGRPSLPALVSHYLDDIGLAKDSPHYKAAVLVAARAEIELAVTPEYHNTNHFADVTAHTAQLLKRHNELAAKDPSIPALTKEEIADSITAAVGHDLDHPGGKNNMPGEVPGTFDRYRLENQSFSAMLPLLKEAGLPEKSIGEINVMILTTSPDGPHSILKAVAKAHQDGNGVDWAKIDPKGEFPELQVLATDRKLTERSAALEDADLGASAFEGLKSNIAMSNLFTQELQSREYRNKAGLLENLNGPLARSLFGQFVVGEGPASVAGQNAVGQNYKDMQAHTKAELETAAQQAVQDGSKPAAEGSKFIQPAEPPVNTADLSNTKKPATTTKARKFQM